MTITHIHRNIMGTVSFDGQFAGMRKPQDFMVYPIHAGVTTARVTIQSDNRMGVIYLACGTIEMSPPRANGGNRDRSTWQRAGALTGEELLALKTGVMGTAGASVGIMTTDNSGAAHAFGSAL